MLLFPIGGVSPLLGLEPVLFRERVHRLTVYTLFEDTSVYNPAKPRMSRVVSRKLKNRYRMGQVPHPV